LILVRLSTITLIKLLTLLYQQLSLNLVSTSWDLTIPIIKSKKAVMTHLLSELAPFGLALIMKKTKSRRNLFLRPKIKMNSPLVDLQREILRSILRPCLLITVTYLITPKRAGTSPRRVKISSPLMVPTYSCRVIVRWKITNPLIWSLFKTVW